MAIDSEEPINRSAGQFTSQSKLLAGHGRGEKELEVAEYWNGYARLLKLVAKADLGSAAARRGSSSLSPGTSKWLYGVMDSMTVFGTVGRGSSPCRATYVNNKTRIFESKDFNSMIKTLPIETVFSLGMPPELDKPLTLCHDALNEIVCFGSTILKAEVDNNEPTETLMTKVFFFRRTLELLDAIANLLKLGITDTSEILLRSLFETNLGLEYLLKEDSDRRALCYQYCDYARKHHFYSKHRPEHKYYDKYSEEYKRGLVFKKIPVYPDLEYKISIAEEWMYRPEHAQIRAEYDSKKKTDPKWYSLFRGDEVKDQLPTVKHLALHLGKFDMYDILYQEWSNATHGSNIGIGSSVKLDDDTLGIIQLRNPIKAVRATLAAARIGLLAIEFMADHIAKRNKTESETISNWITTYYKDYIIEVNSYDIQFDQLRHFP